MKIDLVGPASRGLAMGLNEAAGYGAVAVTAYVTGFIAQHTSLRPQPFFVGLAYAGAGLGLSALLVRETQAHARFEGGSIPHPSSAPAPKMRDVFTSTSFREPALSASCAAGLTNNLNDGMAWGLFPLFFAARGLGVAAIGILVALYPLVWAGGQLVTGALSDQVGRKPLIAGGLGVQALSLALVAAGDGFSIWAIGAIGLGIGTAMAYPTLLAAVGDVAHPAWRASAVGVYRLWRDAGFVVGALLSGAVADLFGLVAAVWTVAVVTAMGATLVVVRMYETRPADASSAPPNAEKWTSMVGR
jgi:MFS family permease